VGEMRVGGGGGIFFPPPRNREVCVGGGFFFFFFGGGGGGGTSGLRYRKRREVLCQRLCTELYIIVRVIKTSECETVVQVRCCYCWGGASSLLCKS